MVDSRLQDMKNSWHNYQYREKDIWDNSVLHLLCVTIWCKVAITSIWWDVFRFYLERRNLKTMTRIKETCSHIIGKYSHWYVYNIFYPRDMTTTASGNHAYGWNIYILRSNHCVYLIGGQFCFYISYYQKCSNKLSSHVEGSHCRELIPNIE